MLDVRVAHASGVLSEPPRVRELSVMFRPSRANELIQKFVSAPRRNQHARRVRYPIRMLLKVVDLCLRR